MLLEFYIIMETIILIVVCVSVILGLRLVTGILYGFCRDIERLLETGGLYGFANTIVTMVEVTGILEC